MSEIGDIIRKIVAPMIKVTVRTGVVLSVDQSDMTCTVDLTTAPDLEGVRIRAAIDGVAEGLLIVPKVGSVVNIASIEDKIESSFVVSYSEIESMNITTEDKLSLNGDSHGGLVKSATTSAEDNTIKQDLNTLKTLISAWVTVPNDGGAALKAILATWAAQTLTAKQPTDYESDKTKHGS